jgi:hypothetical protein
MQGSRELGDWEADHALCRSYRPEECERTIPLVYGAEAFDLGTKALSRLASRSLDYLLRTKAPGL